jgi:hypothetical membrane protein
MVGPGRSSWNPIAIVGTLLFLAGLTALMGIITAEVLYPSGYSTATNEISDLGVTRPPDSIITQPSATIFNTTMIVVGLLSAAGATFLQTARRTTLTTVPLAIFGLGVLGVGIFLGNNDVIHPVFALITFVFGGVAAITSWSITDPPFRYVSALLGIIALFTLFGGAFGGILIPVLGDGGTERWVAYPILVWVMGFGAYLLGSRDAVGKPPSLLR